MEDLYFNLAKEEFSKSRKILLWVLAISASLATLWDFYFNFVKHGTYATIGLTITLILVTIFLYLIAILSTIKRKEHFFKVDSEVISYNYGLMFQKHHSYRWQEVDTVFVPPHSKNVTLLLKDGKAVNINLTWVERNKSRSIRKHIFYSAKDKGINIAKKHYRK